MVPLLFILPPIFHLDGVWMCFPISDAVATVVTAVMLWWQIRRINAEAEERRLRQVSE